MIEIHQINDILDKNTEFTQVKESICSKDYYVVNGWYNIANERNNNQRKVKEIRLYNGYGLDSGFPDDYDHDPLMSEFSNLMLIGRYDEKDIINLNAMPTVYIINTNACGKHTCYKMMDGNITYNSAFLGVVNMTFCGVIIVIFFEEE